MLKDWEEGSLKGRDFDAGTVGPNIHNAEKEDYEGQGECGFLHALQVTARHRKTLRVWSRTLPPFRSVFKRPARSVLRLAMLQPAESEVRQLAVPATKLCLSGTSTAS
jgi:hypothetical protein